MTAPGNAPATAPAPAEATAGGSLFALRAAAAGAAGKVILLGEHAVVHGRPALAVGLSRQVTVRVIPREGTARSVPSDDERVRRAVEVAAAAFDIAREAGFAVEIGGTLPVAVGLGSSAALSVALVRALAASAGVMLSAARLDEVAYELERIFHGTPSGVDSATAAHGSALWFETGPPRRFEPIALKRSLTFVVALTGSRHETARTVGSLRERAAAHLEVYGPVFDAIGALVRAARDALERGEWPRLGRLMTMNHELLRALGVSAPELDELVARALAAGAFGAKMTGGGGGGAAVVLAGDDPTAVLEALRAAGYEAFVQRVEAGVGGSPGTGQDR
jgi:mevalonate kinase